MMVTHYHTNACFEAWMRCEELLTNMAHVQKSFSKKITRVIDECALICMGTFHALKNKSVNSNRFALLCVGICEECAELCDQLSDESFKRCAMACRNCSETISQLVPLISTSEEN